MSDSLRPLVDCSPPDSSVHGILQVRILEWVAIPFSRGSFQPRSPILLSGYLLSEPPGKPRQVRSLTNIPVWTGLKTNRRFFLEFPVFCSRHIECSTFTASSFRICNCSTGNPSPPLALFIGMLLKAHLTSHSRCLALGEWSHHRDYLGCEDLFLYSSSVFYNST